MEADARVLCVVEVVVVKRRTLHQVVVHRLPDLVHVCEVKPCAGLAMDVHDKIEEHLEYLE